MTRVAYDRSSFDMSTFWIIIGLLLLAGLYGLHRLGLWMERKGWIYYRRMQPTPGVRGSMSVFQQIVEPEIRHVVEAKDQSRSEIDQRDPSRK